VRGLRRPEVVLAALTVGVLMAVAGRYGWHRDELYFLQCGRRLAWGYVDQPPFARVAEELFGTSLVGLRLFPALALGAVVLLAARLARELGGGAFAAGLAALAAASSPLFLGLGHLLSTATFDLLAWTVLILVVVRVWNGADRRLWLVAGAVAGVGLLNKHSVAFLLGGLVVGALVTVEGRRQLRSPWLWAGAAVALVIWAPNLLWHARRDWPVLDMLDSLQEESDPEDTFLFAPSQLVVLGPVLAAVWIPGLLWLLRDDAGRRWRALAIAYVALVVVFTVTAAKPYYLAGLYPLLFAAGAIWWEGRRGRRALAVAAGVGAVLALPLALPVVPVDLARHHPIEEVQKEFGAQLGWEELADQVAAVVRGLPAGERSALTIFTRDYGASSAINLYGPDRRLPRAYSGHNNEWFWGPPPERAGPTVVVAFTPAEVAGLFRTCRQVDRIVQPHGVASEEAGLPLLVCRGQRGPWAELWPRTRHFTA